MFEGACGVPDPLIIINNTVGVPQSSGESVDIGQLTIGHVDHWTANSSDPPMPPFEGDFDEKPEVDDNVSASGPTLITIPKFIKSL